MTPILLVNVLGLFLFFLPLSCVPVATDGSSFMSIVNNVNTGFSNRTQANAVILNGNLFVMGGYPQTTDVWSSPDFGATWQQLTSNAPWTGRNAAAEGIFLSPPISTTYGTSPNVYIAPPNTPLMVLLGGSSPGGLDSDAWISPNGSTWARSAASALGQNIQWSALVACNKILYSIGGRSAGTTINTIFRSTDAITWTAITPAPPFAPRSSFAAALTSSNTRIIIAGGQGAYTSALNDVWISDVNVANWTMLTSAAPWVPRASHGLLDVSGYLYLVAGSATFNGSPFYNDIWGSPDDGTTWMQITTSPGFSPRAIYDNLVADGRRLISVGGQDALFYLGYKDVWFGYVA